jgi:tetratricopeptide (TPR) repeat protein
VGSEAIDAGRRIETASPRERAYLDALAVFYQQPAGTSVHDRAVKYEAAMAAMVARFPDDDEASIFYALALNGAALPTDKTHARQKQAAKILNRLLPTHPRHPGIIHYLIHSDDSPELAPLALDAARSYSKIAPAVPHALHMPSHIFTRLGLWDESIASNLKAASTAKEHGEIDEQLHAMDYLEYAYLQLRRDDDARGVVDELHAMTAQQKDAKSTFAIAAIPARYALERHAWREAAALTPAPGIDWEKTPRTAALTEFAIGIGAARSGDIARAGVAEAALTRDAAALSTDSLWGPMVEVARKSVTAWKLYAQSRTNEALATMRAAADQEDLAEKPAVTPGALLPARELLGDMLLQLKRPADALIEYQAVLAVAPNRRNAIAGKANAANAVGEMRRAAR